MKVLTSAMLFSVVEAEAFFRDKKFDKPYDFATMIVLITTVVQEIAQKKLEYDVLIHSDHLF